MFAEEVQQLRGGRAVNCVGELARFVVDLSDTQFPDNSARSDSGNLNDSRFVSSAREVCHIRRLVVKTGGDFGCAGDAQLRDKAQSRP